MYNGYTPTPKNVIDEGFKLVAEVFGDERAGLLYQELNNRYERAKFLNEFTQALLMAEGTQLNLEGAIAVLDIPDHPWIANNKPGFSMSKFFDGEL